MSPAPNMTPNHAELICDALRQRPDGMEFPEVEAVVSGVGLSVRRAIWRLIADRVVSFGIDRRPRLIEDREPPSR